MINLTDGGSRSPLDWYLDARFGMFIHWGIHAVAGVEASWPIMAPDLAEVMFGNQHRISDSEYFALSGQFNPVNFDADEWVCIAKKAGMRYMVFTAKHHDGFCMFDAPGTDFKITNSLFGRDACLELALACDKAKMPLGFYYSPPDMHHPGYRDTRKPSAQNWLGEPDRKEWGIYLDYMESHLRKLLSDYGQVRLIWFDGLSNHAKYDPQRFHRLVRELSPGTLINDRLGEGYDFITQEQFIPRRGIPVKTDRLPAAADARSDRFFILVQRLLKVPGMRGILRRQLRRYQEGTLELTSVPQESYPAPERFQPWETCMTIGKSWGYNPSDTSWKAPRELLRNLVEVASRGGNFLLNVGPTELGTFPVNTIDHLEYIGRWMDRFGESIYGSTYTQLSDQSWGRATRKENKIFLHVFHWPSTGELAIHDFPWAVVSVKILAGESLVFVQNGQQLTINIPHQAPDADVSVLVVECDRFGFTSLK